MSSDEEFDDFNIANADNTEEDEFGDFEEEISDEIAFPHDLFKDGSKLNTKIDQLISEIIPLQSIPNTNTQGELLNDRSKTIYQQVSTIPYLQPTNWIKSNIRHNLLIKLGIPINLDELNQAKEPQVHRRKSLVESDISWDGFDIPNEQDLELDPEAKVQLMNTTIEKLSKIEIELLNNTSEGYLKTCTDEQLDAKLRDLNEMCNELIILSSLWKSKVSSLHADFEIYENVVQSFIGYSQKLKRDEIFENLKKLKHEKKKKNRMWS